MGVDMEIGDLIRTKGQGKYSGRMGLVSEIAYGLPNCIKVFWLDTKGFAPAIASNVEVLK
tara:strand:+ start:656 stop:835 length:180 start_codon:yes stop_codon:yes gene_type:complete